MIENGNKSDITEKRYHHEIYLSDPRKRVMTFLSERINEQRRRHGQRRSAKQNLNRIRECLV